MPDPIQQEAGKRGPFIVRDKAYQEVCAHTACVCANCGKEIDFDREMRAAHSGQTYSVPASDDVFKNG